MKKKETQQNRPDALSAPPNLKGLNRAGLVWRTGAALLSAILLSLAFPPAAQAWLAPAAFFPLLLCPTPRCLKERFFIGYLFGYVHSALSLLWLNEVGFGAGFLLSIWCGLFPMLWYAGVSAWHWHFRDKKNTLFPGAGPLFMTSAWIQLLTIFFTSALWVATEELRGVLLTGFPWNKLGVTLYRHPDLIQLAAFTGVPGLSFLLMLFNGVLVCEAGRIIRLLIFPTRIAIPLHLLSALLGYLLLTLTRFANPLIMPEHTPTIRIGVIQGDIPQCREWTDQQLQLSLNVYDQLSRQAMAEYPDIQLLLWPEAAVPASLDYHPYAVMRYKLLQDLRRPLLVGALQYRPAPQNQDPKAAHLFNSVFLLDQDNRITAYYDKTHRVPFGEFTPFGDQMPWLRELIGMGRDLTPGKNMTLLSPQQDLQIGVNICFEDVFPQISREFTRSGANLLATVTNDSWYNQSAGAEQHLSQMVFRAVENHRPFLRSGNNSHTCMVAPNGTILGKLPFQRTFQAYDVPVYRWKTTFYTEHGNLFAHGITLFAIGGLLFLAMQWLQEKERNLALITSTEK